MKKMLLFVAALLFVQSAEAKIFTTRTNYYQPYNNVYRNYYGTNYNRRYYPPQRYYQPRNNYYYNQQPIIYRSRVRRSSVQNNEKLVANQFSDITKLEKQILSQTYEYDNVKNRIERLEHKIFGAAQNGSFDERCMVLRSAAKNYKAFNPESSYANYGQNSYQGYQPPIFTGTMGSSWKNTLMGNLRNQMMGVPTGFTPAMDPAYMDWFEAERAMMGNGRDIDYRNNYGYYKSNSNQGARTGVTILD